MNNLLVLGVLIIMLIVIAFDIVTSLSIYWKALLLVLTVGLAFNFARR